MRIDDQNQCNFPSRPQPAAGRIYYGTQHNYMLAARKSGGATFPFPSAPKNAQIITQNPGASP
jgi:hypothetical protein